MDFGKKKKKKKKDVDDEDDEEGGENEGAASAGAGSLGPHDRDYHYDELLGRVFGILREKNPALSEKTKTIIKPPQVLREGTKKTVFSNLMEICNAMHRNHDHVIQYMMAELGTSGTLDGQNRLIIKGRFLPKVFEGVLRHYFIEYVICQMCKSSDTQLIKDPKTRLSNCVCQACGASRSVSAIQKGFQAVGRGDRRKARKRDVSGRRRVAVDTDAKRSGVTREIHTRTSPADPSSLLRISSFRSMCPSLLAS